MEELFLPHLIFFCYHIKTKFGNTKTFSRKPLFKSTIGCQETTTIIDKKYVFIYKTTLLSHYS